MTEDLEPGSPEDAEEEEEKRARGRDCCAGADAGREGGRVRWPMHLLRFGHVPREGRDTGGGRTRRRREIT